jgi:coenzyme F420-reducing hydrogenase delta subunit
MCKFYINGEEVSKKVAKSFLDEMAARMGYEETNYSFSWSAIAESESCREFINEISDYQLEIVA